MMKAVATAEREVSPVPSGSATVAEPAEEAAPSRLADYLELTKPRIAVMALFTVAGGYLLGAGAEAVPGILFNVLLGAGLVAAGGSAQPVAFDVTDAEQVGRALDALLATAPVQIVVNNAGVHRDALMAGMNPSDWLDVVDVKEAEPVVGVGALSRADPAARFA